MQGTLTQEGGSIELNTKAEFTIKDEVTEFVTGKLTIGSESDSRNSFERNTHIRTSENNEDEWIHHMTEFGKKING